MKTKNRLKHIISIVVIAFALVSCDDDYVYELEEVATEDEQTFDDVYFKLTIQKIGNEIHYRNIEGLVSLKKSHWIFPGRPIAICERGINTPSHVVQKTPGYADFLFTTTVFLDKTGTRIVLNGKHGTEWEELTLELEDYEKQAIDTYGLTTLD